MQQAARGDGADRGAPALPGEAGAVTAAASARRGPCRPRAARIRALMTLGLPRLDKAVLLGPAAMARAAARGARRPEERWLLHQPRPVRTSYVRQVLEAAGERNAEEVWMLRQPKAVRERYIREVLRVTDRAAAP